jgi:hypothetical protein
MAENDPEKRSPVFISHASADLDVSRQVEAALLAAGFDPWLDYSDIRVGALLGKQLRLAIEESVAVVLMWSKTASASRWVATEVLTTFHLQRFIIPCVLDETELPQFISRSVYFDLQKRQKDVFERLAEQVKAAPRRRNEFPAVSSYQTKELKETINSLYQGQREVLARVGRGDLAGGQQIQSELDKVMHAAETRWRYDPVILNLAGYHRKNAYMIVHWEEYCAGRFPKDPILQEGQRYFFNTLFVNPTDCSALNGLGNMLLFDGELDGAEFFVQKAIECAAEDGVAYSDAQHDLRLIQSRMRMAM